MLGAAQSPGKVTRKAKWIAAKFPYDAPLEQIEARPRERLRRSTVAAAIQALAERLVAEQEDMGADAEVTSGSNTSGLTRHLQAPGLWESVEQGEG